MAAAPEPWRIVIITVLPVVAQGYSDAVRDLGHHPVAVITPRRRALDAPPMPFAAAHVADDPPELDVLFAATKHSLPRLLRAYEPDLAICTGFPWLISQEAIDVPRLGIGQRAPVVPSALPRPLPDRVGDSQR
jgi:methionyl-tRNA formyltransferase